MNESELQNKANKLGIKLLSIEETQNEFNDRLVRKGWSMLNELCPITNYPLLKKGDEIWSVRMNMPVSKQSNSKEINELSIQKSEISKDEVSKLIGEKLLLGWKMLDEDCPITHECPLMLDPKTNKKWSAGLNDYIQEEKKNIVKNEISKDFDISKVIGEKLLLGWKMLDEDCPITHECPLMLDPITNKKWSAGLNDYIQEEKKNIVKNEISKDFDISKVIGEKLLLGWKMLDEDCPITHECPLMLDPKTNKKWSAGLNDYIQEEKKNIVKNEISKDFDISKVIGEKLLLGWKMLDEDCPITHECPLMLDPITNKKWSAGLNDFVTNNKKTNEDDYEIVSHEIQVDRIKDKLIKKLNQCTTEIEKINLNNIEKGNDLVNFMLNVTKLIKELS